MAEVSLIRRRPAATGHLSRLHGDDSVAADAATKSITHPQALGLTRYTAAAWPVLLMRRPRPHSIR